MSKKQIVEEPNKALRRRAADLPLNEIAGVRIRRLVSDMKETLAASNDGVGLAAPQVGVSLRMFVVSDEASFIDRKDSDTNARGEPSRTIRMHTNDTDTKKHWEYLVFINPVLKKRSRKKNEMAEGCLSLPGKFGILPRAEKVFLEWLDEQGKKHSRGFTKFFARVIQHEMDHLDGVLISDRAKKLMAIIKDQRH